MFCIDHIQTHPAHSTHSPDLCNDNRVLAAYVYLFVNMALFPCNTVIVLKQNQETYG